MDIMRIGEIVGGRYEILEPLGAGGQAVLVKALDQDTGDEVVLKQLSTPKDNPGYAEAVARFKRAANICIGYPGVIDPIAYFEEDGEHIIVMPFVQGVTLTQHMMQNGGSLSCDEVCRIVREVAKALAKIHEKHVVHRDLKPDNIMITDDGDVVIVDFGICKNSNEQTITSGNGVVGTLLYMSPQQLDNAASVDHRADLYALGVILYLMLTGQDPMTGNTAGEIATKILKHTPCPPNQIDPSIPEHVSQACMCLVEKLPQDRFQSADEFIAALAGTTPVASGEHFCGQCGSKIRKEFRFCYNCGTQISPTCNGSGRCLACGALAGSSPTCPSCGRPFGVSGHLLSFTSGSLTGTVFRIPEGIYRVGRNELLPTEGHISRRHFLVACSNGSVLVQDAGSANKTYVGGARADLPTPLTLSQQLCIAGNTATYNHN